MAGRSRDTAGPWICPSSKVELPGGMWEKGWVALSWPFSPFPWGGLGWQRPSLRLVNKSLAQWLEAADMIKPPNEGVGAEKGRMRRGCCCPPPLALLLGTAEGPRGVLDHLMGPCLEPGWRVGCRWCWAGVNTAGNPSWAEDMHGTACSFSRSF